MAELANFSTSSAISPNDTLTTFYTSSKSEATCIAYLLTFIKERIIKAKLMPLNKFLNELFILEQDFSVVFSNDFNWF